MRRFLFLPSIALSSALVFSCVDQPTTPSAPSETGSLAAASANAGGRPIDATYSFDIPEGVFCDFALHTEGAEKEKTIELPGDHTLLIFPGAIATWMNLSNGNQETFRIPGSFHITTLENGDTELVFTGRNIIGQPFEPNFLFLAIGTFTYVFDSQGNLVQPLQGSGQLIDVCALLS